MQTIGQQLLLFLSVLIFLNNPVTAQKQWRSLGPSTLSTNGIYPSTYAMAVDTNNIPHVVYAGIPNGVDIASYNGSFWATGSTISSTKTGYISFVFDKRNRPYVAFQDNTNSQKATVMMHNGTQWVPVGSPGVSAGGIEYISLAIDNNDVPYIAYRDLANNGKITVMTYNSMNWVTLGVAGFSTSNAFSPSLAIDNNNIPFIAYLNAGVKTVMKFNGNNWVSVGNPNTFSTPGPYYGLSSNISLAIDGNNTPYIAHREYTDSLKPTVLKFNGTAWVIVGSKGFASATINNNSNTDISIKMDNNDVPYVFFNDDSDPSKAAVMQYNGSTWVNVGKIGIVPFGVRLSLDFDKNNIPYVGFIHNSGFFSNFDIAVMKYDCPPEYSINICAVVTDTATDSNMIVWNGRAVPHVDSYRVYREDGSTYKLLGTVAGTVNSFKDSSADPYKLSYKYKLVLLDSCDRETPIDSAMSHRTIRLKLNYLINDTASLTWNNYEGLANPVYTVKRSNNGGAFTTISNLSITGSDTTYSDTNPLSGSNKYRIDIVLPNSCNAGSITYDKITSNTVYSWNICAVTTDSATNNNIIVWSDVTIPYVDSYRIYREDNSNFIHIGSVAGNVNSFTDQIATPAMLSYKYKLTLLDIYGQETDIDSSWANKSIQLGFDYLIDDTASITWNAYKGLTNPVYTLKRSNNGGAFAAIASFSIAGKDTTYLDANPPSGQNQYRIDIALVNPCNAGATSYNNITSNIVTSWKTGINDIANNRKILLLPNPTDNMLRIDAFESIVKIDVFSLTGKKLLSEKRNGNKNAMINVASLPSGMYLLRVNNLHHASFIRR